jgi:hypothetical protein
MFDFLFAGMQPDTVSLDAGPEYYNCGSCPHNCVGGSETGCPASAPAPPPKPSAWYSVTETSTLASSNAHAQSLEAGPEFYNCGSCPHNCVGGSETSCPASAPAPPPKPSSWYSVTETSTLAASNAHTQSLEAGPEFYNCLTCSHNCVGGSENGCIPGPAEAKIIVHDPSKMQLAAPVAAPVSGAEQVKTVRPGIGHVYNLGPAMLLGALSATAEAGGRLLSGRADDDWMAHFRSETDAAAGAVTPLGQLILRRHVFAGGEAECQ